MCYLSQHDLVNANYEFIHVKPNFLDMILHVFVYTYENVNVYHDISDLSSTLWFFELMGLDPSCFVILNELSVDLMVSYILLCFCGLQGTSTIRPFTNWHMETPACVWRQVSADSTNLWTTYFSTKLKQSWSRRTLSITRWPSCPKTTKATVLKVPTNNSELQNQSVEFCW